VGRGRREESPEGGERESAWGRRGRGSTPENVSKKTSFLQTAQHSAETSYLQEITGDGDGGVATETAGATRDAGARGGTELLVKRGGCRRFSQPLPPLAETSWKRRRRRRLNLRGKAQAQSETIGDARGLGAESGFILFYFYMPRLRLAR
jgi:hypothetical protein